MIALIRFLVVCGFAVVIAIFCFWLYNKKVLSRPLTDWGLKQNAPSLKWIALAVLFPVIYSAITYLFLDGKGNWERSWQDGQQLTNTFLNIIVDLGAGSGIVEELIFRGLIMKSIEWVSNKRKAIIISSILLSSLNIPASPCHY